MLENIVRKEKLLVTSNFSFSHDVFQSYICGKNAAVCDNGLKINIFMVSDENES